MIETEEKKHKKPRKPSEMELALRLPNRYMVVAQGSIIEKEAANPQQALFGYSLGAYAKRLGTHESLVQGAKRYGLDLRLLACDPTPRPTH